MPSESFEPESLQPIGDVYEPGKSMLQDAIALLQAQVESLKQQLANKDQEIQGLEQALVRIFQSDLFEQKVLQQVGDDYEQAESKLQDAIALLQEQVQSLTQQLTDQDQETQSLERELVCAYQDLSSLNRENQELYAEQQLSLSQAQILIQDLLNQGKSIPEVLAAVLSAMYQTQVKPQKFKQQDTRSANSLSPF